MASCDDPGGTQVDRHLESPTLHSDWNMMGAELVEDVSQICSGVAQAPGAVNVVVSGPTFTSTLPDSEVTEGMVNRIGN